MIVAGKYEVPDDCPKDCRFKDDMPMQGGMCHRCPVFNCKGTVVPEEDRHFAGDVIRLLEPEDYRPDWAKEWEEFFKTGKEPELYLCQQP